MNQNNLIQLNGVEKSFRSADGAPRKILDDVNFSLAEGEIVALLGKVRLRQVDHVAHHGWLDSCRCR